MTYDEAMEDGNTCEVSEAIAEITKHGFEAKVMNCTLYAREVGSKSWGEAMRKAADPQYKWETVTPVEDGQVMTANVLGWLGY